MTTLITGASGFIGRRMLKSGDRVLARDGTKISGTVHGDLLDLESLRAACDGIDCVFHCAGYAHAFSSSDPDAHWRINFEGTRNLVGAAADAGVRRFVFLSSVKAMAEPGDECVDEDGWPGEPNTPYGKAKRAAEDVVLEAGIRSSMHVVNLRLTMVYGAGGRGNLDRMGRLVSKGWFPPLPETGNHRSLVHVDDVVSAMLLVADDNRANGRTYIITGPEAPSGRQLYDAMREVLGLPRCRWSVPEAFLHGAARCGDSLEKLLKYRVPLNSEVVDRLLGSAWYSSRRIAQEIGWQPKVWLREGLREMFGC